MWDGVWGVGYGVWGEGLHLSIDGSLEGLHLREDSLGIVIHVAIKRRNAPALYDPYLAVGVALNRSSDEARVVRHQNHSALEL